jgi:hypothetical protein
MSRDDGRIAVICPARTESPNSVPPPGSAMKTLAGAAILALLIAAVPATAQDPNPVGLTLVAQAPGIVPYAGSGSIPLEVSVGCADLLSSAAQQMGATATVTVSTVDAPAWLNATDAAVTVDPQDCNPATAQAVGTGSFEFTVSPAAPAVVENSIKLMATLEDLTDDATVPVKVAYKSAYTLVPSITFPFTVTNTTTTFTVVGTQASNAASMIMVDDFSASGGARVSGIGALQYSNQAGKPESKTYTVTFTAPSGDWETATTTLKVYGHWNCCGGAGDPTDRQTITWEFVNGGIETPGKEKKDSPAPVGALSGLGLLGLAAVLRRKAD